MKLIAHRGCRSQYPENTMAAVQKAAPHVDFIEIDAVRCGSGEIVVFHDGSLERLTGLDARVGDTDWAVLRESTVGSSDEPITLLEDVLDGWPDGAGLNLDFHDEGLVPDALQPRSNLPRPTLVSSSNDSIHERCRRLAVDVLRGYSFAENPSPNVTRAVELGCDFVHVRQDCCLDTDVVERAHDEGLLVDAWSVRDADRALELQARGVDALTVDRWDVL